MRDPAGAWSYARLADLSRAAARGLADHGVGRGSRILVQVPSRKEVLPLLFGASRLGAALIPLDPELTDFQLRSIFSDAEPALAVGDSGLLRAAKDHAVPLCEFDAVLGGDPDSPAADPVAAPAEGEAADLALLIYTSGSTAAPKAVMCPHSAVVSAARAIHAVLGYRHDDVVFCRLPLAFDYALYQVFLAALGRAELVLTGGGPDLVLARRMRECGATVVPIVPSLGSMLAILGKRAPGSVSTVRMFTNTGAALPAALIDELRDHYPGSRVVRMYGITECKRVTIMPPDEERERPQSVGPPLPGTTVRIVDPDGRPLPPGEVGEITVAGPNVMAGYRNAPELTAAAYRRDPQTGDTYLHTGDYGSLDEDGYLYFDGRRDDIFKRRGTRMSTTEIEAAATDIPGVLGAAVLPPDGGRDLTLFVEGEVEPLDVLREMAVRVDPAKVPAVCRVLASIPLTPNGKHSRKHLARLLEEGAG
ncbi:amino acid adenylation domain-containing protein [Murinocardiopsis flavida]|uniref:Amino acid adenylation domain-containing protein n=1 Tax=Murinocardiopsis flavida TaxID=645275 RepID=A0A2P8C856_9ACTN|nr:amino acid adenylation domain-containing protein [Murinocardiopsis flavida]